MKRDLSEVVLLKRLGRDARAATKLAPWLLATILAAGVLFHTDLVATGGLFQSPQDTSTAEPPSPAPTEEPPMQPTAELTEPPMPTDTPVPTDSPVPTDTPEPTVVPTETLPSPTEPLPTATPVPLPTATPEEEQGRYAEGESNLRFEWGMLFDSVALGLTYVWLCCGVVVLFALVVLFVVLWVASRRRQLKEE